MKQKLSQQGFTLMEILVAMAIMGILTVVGFTSYTVSFQKARDAQRKNDLNQLSKALEAYYSDFGVYPTAVNGRVSGCGDGTQVCSWGGAFSLSSGKVYMKQMPREPQANWIYFYVTSTDRKKFQLFAHIENINDPQLGTYTKVCGTQGQACNYGIASSNSIPTEVLQ